MPYWYLKIRIHTFYLKPIIASNIKGEIKWLEYGGVSIRKKAIVKSLAPWEFGILANRAQL